MDDLVHDRGPIGCPTDRLGPEQGHVDGALASCQLDVADERLRQRVACGPAKVARARSGRAESEEDRLIVEGAKPMSRDERDEQVDGIRA
jgi:hypothetical protein